MKGAVLLRLRSPVFKKTQTNPQTNQTLNKRKKIFARRDNVYLILAVHFSASIYFAGYHCTTSGNGVSINYPHKGKINYDVVTSPEHLK